MKLTIQNQVDSNIISIQKSIANNLQNNDLFVSDKTDTATSNRSSMITGISIEDAIARIALLSILPVLSIRLTPPLFSVSYESEYRSFNCNDPVYKAHRSCNIIVVFFHLELLGILVHLSLMGTH